MNKLSDSSGEEYETEVWLAYSQDCKYISDPEHVKIMNEYDEVRKMLIPMIRHPDKWCA